MPYNKLFINLASACSVCTQKYRTSVFLYKPHPTDMVCTKKIPVRYFSVQTSHSVNKKLIINLYTTIILTVQYQKYCIRYSIYETKNFERGGHLPRGGALCPGPPAQKQPPRQRRPLKFMDSCVRPG
jgi:hypothetical protein